MRSDVCTTAPSAAKSRYTLFYRQLDFSEGKITCKKSSEIPMKNQKSRTPWQEVTLKNKKSLTSNKEVNYPSDFSSEPGVANEI